MAEPDESGGTQTAEVTQTPSFMRGTHSHEKRNEVSRASIFPGHRRFSASKTQPAVPTARTEDESNEKTQRFMATRSMLSAHLTKSDKTWLRNVNLFKRCSQKFLEMLEVKADNKMFAPGDVVFKQGDLGDCMYIINRGEVEVLVDGNVVGSISDGHVFGEMAAICKDKKAAKRMASIRAKMHTDCCVIKRDALLQTLSRFPPDESVIEQEVTRRLQDLLDKGILVPDELAVTNISNSALSAEVTRKLLLNRSVAVTGRQSKLDSTSSQEKKTPALFLAARKFQSIARAATWSPDKKDTIQEESPSESKTTNSFFDKIREGLRQKRLKSLRQDSDGLSDGSADPDEEAALEPAIEPTGSAGVETMGKQASKGNGNQDSAYSGSLKGHLHEMRKSFKWADQLVNTKEFRTSVENANTGEDHTKADAVLHTERRSRNSAPCPSPPTFRNPRAPTLPRLDMVAPGESSSKEESCDLYPSYEIHKGNGSDVLVGESSQNLPLANPCQRKHAGNETMENMKCFADDYAPEHNYVAPAGFGLRPQSNDRNRTRENTIYPPQLKGMWQPTAWPPMDLVTDTSSPWCFSRPWQSPSINQLQYVAMLQERIPQLRGGRTPAAAGVSYGRDGCDPSPASASYERDGSTQRSRQQRPLQHERYTVAQCRHR